MVSFRQVSIVAGSHSSNVISVSLSSDSRLDAFKWSQKYWSVKAPCGAISAVYCGYFNTVNLFVKFETCSMLGWRLVLEEQFCNG
jgi:hypothetical protein